MQTARCSARSAKAAARLAEDEELGQLGAAAFAAL